MYPRVILELFNLPFSSFIQFVYFAEQRPPPIQDYHFKGFLGVMNTTSPLFPSIPPPQARIPE